MTLATSPVKGRPAILLKNGLIAIKKKDKPKIYDPDIHTTPYITVKEKQQDNVQVPSRADLSRLSCQLEVGQFRCVPCSMLESTLFHYSVMWQYEDKRI